MRIINLFVLEAGLQCTGFLSNQIYQEIYHERNHADESSEQCRTDVTCGGNRE